MFFQIDQQFINYFMVNGSIITLLILIKIQTHFIK